MVLAVFAACKRGRTNHRASSQREDFVVIVPAGPPETKGCVGVAHAITRFTLSLPMQGMSNPTRSFRLCGSLCQ